MLPLGAGLQKGMESAYRLRMTRLLHLLLLLLAHTTPSNSFKRPFAASSLTGSTRYIHRSIREKSLTELHVVEHLVDCASNPAIAELYGGLSSDFCLQRAGESSSSLFRGLGGLVEQAATIGFLVMSYFFFKRTANGISEWEEEDDDDEVTYNNDNLGVEERFGKELRRCPQCNGRGKFEFDGNSDSAPVCDLCGGSGSIVRSVRAKTLGLPKSSRELWSDSNSDNLDT